MYIVIRNGQPVGWQKFHTSYEAKVWCLHNGLATLKTINKEGDTMILLYTGVYIEKLS